ncbi:MAG: 4-hydroxy-tetrahydrodipicolinate reductase [Chitinophagia bacterium]|jgi:4-hydroxy-tetrahydrodipicolinate reductase|nr:4-hydroxy-tetrahydrodipicolinate reductase [Chitinophagia bacterium]NCA29340.1 4-hydroxy-tetrahydrodipicolinate reductase [Chitinophagia bacterium]
MKIAIIGYGKMGKAIEEIAVAKGHEIILKIDAANTSDFTKENIQNADVAIEFTGPQSAFENITKCIQWGVPVVSGSTGWLDNFEKAKKLCEEKKGCLLYASNFSIGVNLFFEINKQVAALMEPYDNYDVSMTEIHHTEKKDAPSGTAISLAEQILAKIGRKNKWVNEPSNESSNEASNLIIRSERIDPAPGTHSIIYNSPIDSIEIKHTAHTRKGFAGGAVLAAEFVHKKIGIFTMSNVLGL